MADIVIGIASSHTPQLSSGVDMWPDHALRDQRYALLGKDARYHTYDGDAGRRGPGDRRGARARRLGAQVPAGAGGDRVAVRRARRPPARTWRWSSATTSGSCSSTTASPPSPASPGPSCVDMAPDAEAFAKLPQGIQAAYWAVHGEQQGIHPVAKELSAHIAERLALADFDLTVFTRQPAGRTLGHAFTFPRYRLGLPGDHADRAGLRQHLLPAERAVRRALLRPRPGTAPRGRELGVRRAGRRHRLRRADPLRHRRGRSTAGSSTRSPPRTRPPSPRIPRDKLRSGNSEILNWVTAAGALEGLTPTIVDYVPGYRTPAGTGTGMAFARWE